MTEAVTPTPGASAPGIHGAIVVETARANAPTVYEQVADPQAWLDANRLAYVNASNNGDFAAVRQWREMQDHVFRGAPAPVNLKVPPYTLTDGIVVIGEDQETKGA